MRHILIALLVGGTLGCGSDTPSSAPLTTKQQEKEKSGPGGAPGGPRSK
jgi:hypothetical protein